MVTVLAEEDLKDLALLKKKLNIPAITSAPSPDAMEILLSLTSRLVGQQSLLHYKWREAKDVGRLEKLRMDFNTKMIDGKIMEREMVLASPQQQQIMITTQNK